jgi:hypothetical protein
MGRNESADIGEESYLVEPFERYLRIGKFNPGIGALLVV